MPQTSVVNVFNAAVIAAALSATVPAIDLAVWLAAMVLMSGIRVIGAGKYRQAPDSALIQTNPLILTVIASALMWSIPAILWAPLGTENERVLIAMATIGMMSGGSVTLATVPSAALSYVAILALAMVAFSVESNQLAFGIITVVASLTLCYASLSHARHFTSFLRAQIELEEQGEMIALLREFEACGSDWLWELDGELRLTYVSRDMAAAIGRPHEQILGEKAAVILDPTGRIAEVSVGMAAVFEHISSNRSFRDIAIPTLRGRWWSLSGKPLLDCNGRCIGWRGVGSDITDVRLKGNDAVRAARRDPLTGLGNRLLVREQLEEALLRDLDSGVGCSLMLVDLDRFKLVNDTLGHSIGDELLKQVAQRLTESVRADGLVGRVGGDEFAVIWPAGLEQQTLASRAMQLIAELSRPYVVAGTELHIGATIGIARAPQNGISQEELVSHADLALYRAKEERRGTHCFFDPSMFALAQANRQLEADLRSALCEGGLRLAYQPIVSAADLTVTGYEALLRWRHPVHGEIPPDRFVPVIEDVGLMGQIGSWVVKEACAQAARWPNKERIAINVSAAQLSGPGLAATVINALGDSGLEPDRLEIEVTEAVFLRDDAGTLAVLAGLRKLGVRLVLDDFGKGYSSFGYLSRARFSKIKIDRSFVRGAALGQLEHLAIVEAILALARRLGIETTAEGVETADEERTMRSLGCDQFQGFRFGRPAPGERLHLAVVRPLRSIA